MSPHDRWALTPPFHPYCPKAAVYFCYRTFSLTKDFPLGSMVALCCPDFPLTHHVRQRQTLLLFSLQNYTFFGYKNIKSLSFGNGICDIGKYNPEWGNGWRVYRYLTSDDVTRDRQYTSNNELRIKSIYQFLRHDFSVYGLHSDYHWLF